MENLIIFGDYGLDDAAATVSIFNHANRFNHIDIVAIGGNVPADVSLRNCLTLLGYFPDVWSKVTVVDTTSIPQASEYLADIHGNDGMGDLFEVPSTHPDVNIMNFNEWLSKISGENAVLSLGPMSLVKPVTDKIACNPLVIMGGCINEEPNFGEYEFNHCLDPEAFSYCTKLTHAAITLDTCRTEKLDMRRYTIEGDDIHSRILRADQRLSITRNEDGCYVWDDVAACYLLFPERFELKEQIDPHGNRIFNAVYISDKLYFAD